MPTLESTSDEPRPFDETKDGQLTDRASAALPWLERLIAPVSKEEFFRDYWEKKPLVVRHKRTDYFASLLSLADIDRVITTLDRRYPDILLKDAAKPELGSEQYTLPSGALDVVKLYELFQKGSTITLAFLDTVLPALTVFCRSLEREFSCPLQTNIYMTPPGAQGAPPHYDTHDVFVLQVSGSKRWTIFGTPVESPLPGQGFDAKVHQLGAKTLEFELEAGDVAYVPRGVAHEAKSTETISLHITTGILRYTWADMLLETVAAASLDKAAFRKALPPGFAKSDFDNTQMREQLRHLLRQAADGDHFDAVFDAFVDRFLSRCPPVLEGQMAQLARLESLTIDAVVGARQGVLYRLQDAGEKIAIETYGRTITFPSYASEALRFALSHVRFGVRDLPGQLDEAGKLTLVRRLIREGLLAAAIA